jgi:myo-inositol-1(or 4)-monophosphatase
LLTHVRFIGEETYSKGSSKQYLVTNAPTWIVDPLDGTVNYTHLFPMFCVSIAMCLNGVPVIGIIHAPLLDVTYSAYSGYGAWMNDSTPSSPSNKPRKQLPLARNPVPPLPANAPSGCIFSCEWGKDRRDIPEGNMHCKVNSFMNMAAEIGGRGGKGGMVHGVRSLGRFVHQS